MENFLNRMADKASRTVRHWWLYLITGILSIIAGIVVFCNPIESYLTLSIMFGILMLISGIVELVVSTPAVTTSPPAATASWAAYWTCSWASSCAAIRASPW